jgi:CheY-like chemotaxis protein
MTRATQVIGIMPSSGNPDEISPQTLPPSTPGWLETDALPQRRLSDEDQQVPFEADISWLAPLLIQPTTRIAPTRAMSILIVDDIAMNRDIAGSILRAAGYEVTCEACGADAIAAIKVNEFDVILMDVRMPEMDGLEATRQIRALEGGRGRVPIVALTAQNFPEQIDECRKAGMNGHVSKPFDPDKLTAAVAGAAMAGPAQTNSREPEFMMVGERAPVVRRICSELRLVDIEAFKRTASYLAPKTIASYLGNIAGLAKALLIMLDGPDIPDYDCNEFAGAAHVVAGTAGMFGFERLTVASRQYERASESGASDAPLLGEALSAAIEETLPEIHSRILAAADA